MAATERRAAPVRPADAPAGDRLEGTFHWHWEIHPRLRTIAGLERATALAVNPATPENAAEVLRTHIAGNR